MNSLFAKGAALQKRMFEVAAVPIAYRRDGAAVAADIPAKLGRTLFRAENEYGITIRTEQRDFIVRAAELPIDEPRIGDEIIFDGRRYLVTAPNGEPCWRWHSRLDHSELRIHAKEAGKDTL